MGAFGGLLGAYLAGEVLRSLLVHDGFDGGHRVLDRRGTVQQLAEFLHSTGHKPEQVPDFYPTPGTVSTCMYYTGLDPRTMEPVYVARTPEEKAMQRALLQFQNPANRRLVLEALRKAGREDLIGFGKNCLVPPYDRRRRKKQ